jgi:uncharacterized integral membrane protein
MEQQHQRTEATAPPEERATGPVPHKIHRTRLSSAWVTAIVAVILLIALIIFIAQNGRSVEVRFITASGHFPLAVALLCAAVAGALTALGLGTARIVQLRRVAKRHRRQDLLRH